MANKPASDDLEKVCVTCGRRFAWRRKWAANWHAVRYCSAGCRRQRRSPDGEALEAAIIALLSSRAARHTICPSEAARQVRADDCKALMQPARDAARRLVAQDRVRILQRGRAVDPSTARGPIRIGRGPAFDG
ncbi:MAG: hypothetical protein ACI9U2_000772 [Bradymonadia bacterium]|jgi:hypothetical protein